MKDKDYEENYGEKTVEDLVKDNAGICVESKECAPAAPVCADCVPPKSPCPQGGIFNCCTGAGLGPAFVQQPDVLLQTPVSLVCATLDTSCLCKPMVKVEYSSIVKTASINTVTPEEISLTFQLKKTCDNGQVIVCDTRTLTRDGGFLSNNDSFVFTFCDCNPCAGCCTYSVELLSFVLDEGFVGLISVVAPTIRLTATDICGVQEADGETKCPCLQDVLFNCCTGTGIPNTSVCPSTPRSLVCATIDTTRLCKPLVEVNFSAVIDAAVPAGDLLTLTFQVKKSCDNGQEIDCGSWTFTRLTAGLIGTDQVNTSDSFRFTFCDCNPCPACCTYSVELASCAGGSIVGIPFTGSFGINAPTVSIMAFDICPQDF
ncbi:MAG: DUF4489 domain-containing protein [Firmicutes bacterium]|nr:DUF4489 domain-containing protein [Bacillota bacterium]